MINIDQKILNLLGIARRAGELVTGEEMVLKSIQHGQTKLVFLAQDAGTTTQKKFRDKCQSYQVTLCQRYTRTELSHWSIAECFSNNPNGLYQKNEPIIESKLTQGG